MELDATPQLLVDRMTPKLLAAFENKQEDINQIHFFLSQLLVS